jgi:hypothetical protein
VNTSPRKRYFQDLAIAVVGNVDIPIRRDGNAHEAVEIAFAAKVVPRNGTRQPAGQCGDYSIGRDLADGVAVGEIE